MHPYLVYIAMPRPSFIHLSTLPTSVRYETPPISAFDMSRQPTFSSTIHFRDFVDAITDDSTRDAPNYTEIHMDINIFDEDGFYSPDIIAEPIRTRIHAYMTRDERGVYVPNTFFYADGRFCEAADW